MCSPVAAVLLLLLCAGPAAAESNPRFYAFPGWASAPSVSGEPMEIAAVELWRLTGFAHDDQGRLAAFVDSGGNLCIRNPGWCISEDDGQVRTPGFLA